MTNKLVVVVTASRNVAFKVGRMREAIMEGQDELIKRKSEFEDVASEANNKAILEDIGCNADLYIANQEDNTQIQTFDHCSAELNVKVS